MRTKKSREGYLFVDHRASPGLPPEVAIAAGYDPKAVAEGKILETASLTCSHCKTVVVKNPSRVRERAECPRCDHYICDFCDAQQHQPGYVHTPFTKLEDVNATLVAKGRTLTDPFHNMLLFPDHSPKLV